jgi:hypothetical protein
MLLHSSGEYLSDFMHSWGRCNEAKGLPGDTSLHLPYDLVKTTALVMEALRP